MRKTRSNQNDSSFYYYVVEMKRNVKNDMKVKGNAESFVLLTSKLFSFIVSKWKYVYIKYSADAQILLNKICQVDMIVLKKITGDY
jgi:hypothetical protein